MLLLSGLKNSLKTGDCYNESYGYTEYDNYGFNRGKI